MAFIKTFTAKCDHCGESEITVKAMNEQQADDNIINRGWTLVGGHACLDCQIKNPILKRRYMVERGLAN